MILARRGKDAARDLYARKMLFGDLCVSVPLAGKAVSNNERRSQDRVFSGTLSKLALRAPGRLF